VDNYFNYFTEVEERFLRRRGGGLLLSTLDWALIETWKDAGIPVEAVLRGIDAAFDRYDQRPSRSQKINSLAYCSQAVLAAAEDMKEAAVGTAQGDHEAGDPTSSARPSQGFEPATVAAFLERCAESLKKMAFTDPAGIGAKAAQQAERRLLELGKELRSRPVRLEDLERHLTVLEEKLFAALLSETPDDEIVTVRAEADRDLAAYRSKMSGPQIEQLHRQYVHKRLLEKNGLPRLSLFYMT
jgi:hypothetical protein